MGERAETQSEPLPLSRTVYLVAAILWLSVLSIANSEFHLLHWLTPGGGTMIGYLLLGANFFIAILGLRGAHRILWAVYLIASVLGVLLIGMSTPISALWSLGSLYW